MRISFLVLSLVLFGTDAFAVKYEAACDSKPKLCVPLSGNTSATGEIRAWILGQAAGKPGQCWWTCDVDEAGTDPAIKPLEIQSQLKKYGPKCISASKTKEYRCFRYEDGSADKRCKGYWARNCLEEALKSESKLGVQKEMREGSLYEGKEFMKEFPKGESTEETSGKTANGSAVK